ncbi:MAG TPA: helix-turn-helix domain-containing protein [Candidatus Methanoperedens sp.]|nr:helix-turn-helix domain-containing protein [Candidatus Methanoperedens sp.]HLB71018.1 helix-turn-helix domain-containing protein [Candidatus Methanoperedens sp.]
MRWAALLLKIPDNWMTQLLHEHNVHIRVFGCRPYGSHGGRGLVKLNTNDNLTTVLSFVRKRREVLRTSFSRLSDRTAFGEVIIDRCAACSALRQSECFMVSSQSRSNGWLEWAVAAESNSSIYTLVDLLERHGCEIQLNRISASSSNHQLTQRQKEILQFAYSNGYYDYPRRIQLKELASIFEISPSTMSEILRAGYRRVFSEYFDLSSM